MSAARKCDKCARLYEPARGCVTLDVHVTTKSDTFHTWGDVDLCHDCSARLLLLLDPALDDISETLKGSPE